MKSAFRNVISKSMPRIPKFWILIFSSDMWWCQALSDGGLRVLLHFVTVILAVNSKNMLFIYYYLCYFFPSHFYLFVWTRNNFIEKIVTISHPLIFPNVYYEFIGINIKHFCCYCGHIYLCMGPNDKFHDHKWNRSAARDTIFKWYDR